VEPAERRARERQLLQEQEKNRIAQEDSRHNSLRDLMSVTGDEPTANQDATRRIEQARSDRAEGLYLAELRGLRMGSNLLDRTLRPQRPSDRRLMLLAQACMTWAFAFVVIGLSSPGKAQEGSHWRGVRGLMARRSPIYGMLSRIF
jgi:hypothetical protein